MKWEAAFTLIELMVTIAVAAVLLAVAVPNMQSFMVNSTLSGISTDFMSALNYARSEAITRGTVPVIVCRKAVNNTCATGSGNWNNGWLLFADNNSSGAYDTGDDLIRVYQSLATNYSGSGSTAANSGVRVNSVSYNRDGRTTQAAIFAFCFNSEEDRSRAVTVTLTRPRIATDSDANGIPERENNTDINTCEAP